MEDDRDYGMGGSQRDRGRYSNERGSYGSRSGGGSGHDPYGSGRGDYGPRRGEGSGRGDFSDAIGAGMAGRGMGIANYASGSGGDYGGSSYGRDYGGQGYGQGRSRAGSEDRGFFERAGDEVASWFGDEDAQRRRENDGGHRGRGPRNYSRSDERIREDVSDRLSDDRHIDASDIEVSVSGGEVTLDGTVENRLAKRHAEDLAESCSGVKHVQNNLRVKDRQTSTGMSGTMSGGMSSGMSSGSTGSGGTGSGNTGMDSMGAGSSTDSSKTGTSQT
jgi:osmotically-inducible protein OsmY